MRSQKKIAIKTVKQKNLIINNIIKVIEENNHFLILGHRNPDEDCLASMVALGLILTKFYKDSKIYIDSKVNENYQYLLNICKYNSINIINSIEEVDSNLSTIIVCDTAKHSLLEVYNSIDRFNNKGICKIEFDHHIGADSEYIGDKKISFIAHASSTCELVGQFMLNLSKKKTLLEKYHIDDLFSRNIILAILTGIIGDSKMGQFLKSKNEIKYYNIFSSMFNKLLKEKTVKESNFSSKEQVFTALERLSENEAKFYNIMIGKKKFSKSIGYVTLTKEEMDPLIKEFKTDTIVSVSRTVADELAEQSKKLSLVCYYDDPKISNLIQFRIRRSKDYKVFDLRTILKTFSIADGGGHEGAIGFRFPRNKITNIDEFVEDLINKIEGIL
jgi:nanoRNase/pAp phosphatase (c-di-AMP/oligoRNAs hydrolase)